ncbi:hypothetical protein KI387_035568, partial [Taxus chinensis]
GRMVFFEVEAIREVDLRMVDEDGLDSILTIEGVDDLEGKLDLEEILDGFDLELLIMEVLDEEPGPKMDGDAPKSDDVALYFLRGLEFGGVSSIFLCGCVRVFWMGMLRFLVFGHEDLPLVGMMKISTRGYIVIEPDDVVCVIDEDIVGGSDVGLVDGGMIGVANVVRVSFVDVFYIVEDSRGCGFDVIVDSDVDVGVVIIVDVFDVV